MLYALKHRQTDETLFVVSDSICVIATIMIEGPIKGVPTKKQAFIPALGIPPVLVDEVYAEPIEAWPNEYTSKLRLFK